jgi:hypothetical protein
LSSGAVIPASRRSTSYDEPPSDPVSRETSS